MSATSEDQSKKRKIESADQEIVEEQRLDEQLIDEVSDAFYRLSLQKQTEDMMKKLVEQSSGESKKSSNSDRLSIIQQMQQDEVVVLNVGGKFSN